MIPVNEINTIEIRVEPSDTWALLIDKNAVGAKIDGIKAVAQSVYLILNTERYRHEIYSWDYGIELNDLYGQPRDYVYPEVKRRVTDALMVDDRITGVSNFQFSKVKDAVQVTFTVSTVFGEIEADKVVSV